MCLSHLAEVASNKRPITENEPVEEKISTEDTLERPTKKVRFEGVEDSSSVVEESSIPAAVAAAATEGTSMTPADLEKLMQKVRRRAERRKRRSLRSPPPPPPAAEETASASSSSQEEHSEQPDELLVMQRKLERMEQAIKKSARMELQLMNQSKKLRDERALLTRKYESMAEQLREMQRAQQAGSGQPPVLFQMGPLPPLMSVPGRRIVASKSNKPNNMSR